MKKGLLIVLVIAILGIGGWLILKPDSLPKNNQNTVQQPSNSQRPQLKKYDNKHLSLQYPSNWKVIPASGSPDEFVTLDGPVDDAIVIKDFPNLRATKRHLQLYVGRAAAEQSCRRDCKIYDVVPLAKSDAPGAKLVISDWDSQGYATITTVTDDPTVKKGATVYNLNSTISGQKIYLVADVMYNKNSSEGWITDVPAFEKTKSFKELVDIIRSVIIK